MCSGELKSRNGEPPAHPARTDDDLFALQLEPTFSFDRVRVNKPRGAGSIANRYSYRIDLLAKGRMRLHLVNDFAHTREQPRILEHRVAYGDAIPTELAGFPDQPGGMGQCAHRNWSVISRQAAKLVCSLICLRSLSAIEAA